MFAFVSINLFKKTKITAFWYDFTSAPHRIRKCMETLEIYMENFVPQRSRKLEIFDLLYANIQKMSVCGELVVCVRCVCRLIITIHNAWTNLIVHFVDNLHLVNSFQHLFNSFTLCLFCSFHLLQRFIIILFRWKRAHFALFYRIGLHSPFLHTHIHRHNSAKWPECKAGEGVCVWEKRNLCWSEIVVVAHTTTPKTKWQIKDCGNQTYEWLW